jgi:FtsX-like permease family
MIGLFGGLSYAVTQRTREIGVRTALGATPGQILGLVLRQGALMAVIGVAVGLGLAVVAVRYLTAHLLGSRRSIRRRSRWSPARYWRWRRWRVRCPRAAPRESTRSWR